MKRKPENTIYQDIIIALDEYLEQRELTQFTTEFCRKLFIFY